MSLSDLSDPELAKGVQGERHPFRLPQVTATLLCFLALRSVGASAFGSQYESKLNVSPPDTYKLQIITAQGATRILPLGINNHGDVVGVIAPSGGHRHAFLWRKGRVHDLGRADEAESKATAINDRGDVVGATFTLAGQERAVLWRDTKRIILDPANEGRSSATGINNAGQIVGIAESHPGTQHLVLWQNAIPVEVKQEIVMAPSINTSGQVAATTVFSGRMRAMVWDHQRSRTLPSLSDNSADSTSAASINSLGQVAGQVTDLSHFNSEVAVLWKGNVVSVISSQCFATGVNRDGMVVGYTVPHVGISQAFVWTDGMLKRLFPARIAKGDLYSQASAINDRGQIAGFIELISSPRIQFAFLLTPRPHQPR